MNRAAASRTPLYPLLSVLVLDAMVHTTVSTPNTNNENGECAVDPSVTKNTLLDDDVFNTVFLPSLWLSARCRAPPPVIVPNFTRLGSRPWYFAVPLPRKEQQPSRRFRMMVVSMPYSVLAAAVVPHAPQCIVHRAREP